MKRIVSLMLSLVIILSLVCVGAPSVSAASSMKTSTMGINMIKSFEGFSKMPHYDNGQWTVGYGTGVSGKDLENYNANGITEEQATKLLTEYLASFEKSVNSFIDTNKLNLAQHQFDALVSFTYNLGPSWMQSSGTFRSAVINGTTGNEFIYAMAQFGKAGGMAVAGLVERRLCEANLYLNGVYGTEPPVNFKYVIYSGNLDGAVPDVTIQGYDTTKPAAIKATVSKSGYRFLGWYTKEEGGEWITSLGQKSAAVNRLYAHWQQGEGELNTDGSIKGVAAEYTGYAPAGAQKTYKTPNGTADGSVKAEQQLKVVAEYVDSKGVKWGKLSTGKWLTITGGLASTPVFEKPESVIEPITVTVTTGGVNNRIGPGTNYAKQGTYSKGQQLVLTAVQKGGNYTWGKSEQGWIALQYTDYEISKILNSADAKKVTAIGTIIKTDVVNVRAGAGTNHAKVGTYSRNDEVKITLRQKVGSTTWGLTEKGWVSLYYVKVTEVAAGSVPDIELSNGATGGTTSGGTITGGTNTGNGTTVVLTGMIYNCDALRIRSGAGTSNAHIGDYARGTYVNIYETTTVRSETWGRTEKGWISLRYVKLDAPTTGLGVTGRVVKCTTLNVRSGAGTHYPKVDKLTAGTKVEILDYTKVGNTTWGRINQGWISLNYVSLDAPVTDLDNMNNNVGGTGSEPTATEPTATEPQATKYTITVGSATNGKVTASAASAAKDTQVTLTVTPDAGYALDTLTVKDASGTEVTTTDNKFTMPASNVTVTATFKVQYTVKINAAANGKVTANTTACAPNTEIVLTVAPDAGYELDTLTAMNTTTNTKVDISGGKFTMPAGNVNVVATFKQSKSAAYSVTINDVANGSVTASTTTAKKNDVVTLTVAPSADYVLDELTIKDATNKTHTATNVEGNTYTFTMPASNVTVAASFKKAMYTVKISNSTGGAVSVNPDKYESGSTVSLLITPSNAEYVLKTLTVKAGTTEIGTTKDGSTYKFTMPAADVEVKATFEKIQYALTIGELTGGTVTAKAESFAKGDNVELTVKPSTGYLLDKLTVKSGTTEIETTKSSNVYSFKMPNAAVSVEATFKKRPHTLTINTNSHGKITADKETYGYQDVVTLTVEPANGYVIKAVAAKITSDDTKLEVKQEGGKYTFVMPNGAATVAASYAAQYKVTYAAGQFVNIREGKDTNSKDLGDIPNGTIIVALEEESEWIKVKYDSIEGWVLKSNLTKVAQ